jgi:hypothetical protein
VTGTPDPTQSRAVLIGISTYSRMPKSKQLPAVRNNLDKLADLLCDERVWGLPRDHCTVLRDVDSPESAIQAIRAAAKAAADCLVFYYAGHGLAAPAIDDDLYLALSPAYEPGGTHLALRYALISSLIRNDSHAKGKVVILDCCWSGLAIKNSMSGDEIGPSVAIDGTAVLTACAATRRALSPPDENFTAFTGALIDILDYGIPDAGPTLKVQTIFSALRQRLRLRQLPLPELAGFGGAAEIVLGHNTAWQSKVDIAPVSAPSASKSIVTTQELSPEAVKARIQTLVRAGAYEEALTQRLESSQIGRQELLQELILQLRRMGLYEEAAELERSN